MNIKDIKSPLYGLQLTDEESRLFFKKIMGDKLRYMQILLNFLSNAIKFSEEGKSITVRVVLLEIQIINSDF